MHKICIDIKKRSTVKSGKAEEESNKIYPPKYNDI